MYTLIFYRPNERTSFFTHSSFRVIRTKDVEEVRNLIFENALCWENWNYMYSGFYEEYTVKLFCDGEEKPLNDIVTQEIDRARKHQRYVYDNWNYLDEETIRAYNHILQKGMK